MPPPCAGLRCRPSLPTCGVAVTSGMVITAQLLESTAASQSFCGLRELHRAVRWLCLEGPGTPDPLSFRRQLFYPVELRAACAGKGRINEETS